jgi:cephalosporin hydroxylase
MKSLANTIDDTLTDKNTLHSYIPVYQKLFSPIRHSVKHILEIGIANGGSLLLWHDFFPNAIIHGIDISPRPKILDNYERIKTHQFNAYELPNIKSFFEKNNIKFDVIIDDGPHRLTPMCVVAKHYTPHLTSDGILIIEDISQLKWIPTIKTKLPLNMQKNMIIIDNRHIKNRYDDVMIIAKNKELSE